MGADNLKATLYEAIILGAGGTVDDLPDNLESTYLKRIAEVIGNSGGGNSGGGIKLVGYTAQYETDIGGNNWISPSYDLRWMDIDDSLYMFVFYRSSWDGTYSTTHSVSFAQLKPSVCNTYGGSYDILGTKIGEYDIRIREGYSENEYEYGSVEYWHYRVLTIELNGELVNSMGEDYTHLNVYKLS